MSARHEKNGHFYNPCYVFIVRSVVGVRRPRKALGSVSFIDSGVGFW